ncbi:hypothetical protein CPTAKMECS_132 [Salmonella phage vB_SenS-AKM_ECS]|uniref:Uncharacterized protein n=2 Tax=Epseptimavirus TaxID=2732017 RepID=A0A7S9XD03_9CAUD|nr:hypothetical protein GECvBN7_gp079c [Salmonella phage GEC_vB_N7]WLI71413.1 hypothetical protein CPTAKMECS_132 [Salmonella phage vB_SenS-AKM_ECS]
MVYLVKVQVLLLLDTSMAQRVTVHLSREFPGRESRCNQLVVSVMSFGEPPQLKSLEWVSPFSPSERDN